MADSEQDLGGDVTDTGDTGAGADAGAGDAGDTSTVADDFPTVEPAPEPDNPRYSTEHEEPEGEPQPIPGGDGGEA
ncbi:MAG TPA: hypothetical protein VFV09_15625 [Actinomycetota bacterium]|jgi:hypothetical protein|nr:hypothetical protein [Actinomycetota bacterium]